MNNLAIRTENISRFFKTVRAVDSLSLEIPKGIVFGFLGPNGAGKTTTIRLLLGLLEPSEGKAEVLGFDSRSHAQNIREQTGALLEHTGLYERLSAEDNLDFYGRVYRLSHSERRARIKELLTHFDLWERRRERVGTWSRGMKQKLAVARAILNRPSLLFLDEPTAGLDPVAAASLREDLADYVTADGLTVFLTTHNLTEAEKLCNQVGVINKGKLLKVGHPDELRSHGGNVRAEVAGHGFTENVLTLLKDRPEVADVRLINGRLSIELNEDACMAPLVRLMVNRGIDIEEIRKEIPSLEEAFLTLLEEEQ